MTQNIHRFAIADPRSFDGNPYEVAARAVRQTGALAALVRESLEPTRVVARNAELDRQLALTGECDSRLFEDGPQGRAFAAVLKDVEEVERKLKLLERAAGFDPKAPLGKA